MQKALSLGYSSYDSFNSHRNLHSILMTSNDDSISWYYSSFIQLNSSKELHGGVSYDFSIDSVHQPSLIKKCPLVDCYVVPYDMVSNNDIISFCIDSIDKGYYIYLTASQYYISQYYYYQKEHRFHDLFIYGYDTDNRKMLSRDFFSYKQIDALIDFDELVQSYEEGKTFPFYTGGIFLVKKTDKYSWKFEIENYRYNLEAYINSDPVVLYHYNYDAKHDFGYIDKENYFFGLDCYNSLENIIRESIEFGSGVGVIPFHICERHKRILLDGIEYIIGRGFILNNHIDRVRYEFTEIHKKANNILSRILKYNGTRNVDILKRVLPSLKELRQDEKETLTNLITILANKSMLINTSLYERRWRENKNLSYLDLYHEKDKYIRKVFFGNTLEIYSNVNVDQGTMKISVDGKCVDNISLTSDIEQTGKRIFRCNSLSDTYHIVAIEPGENSPEINVTKVISAALLNYDCTSQFEFIDADTETKGNWIGRYGTKGYDIINYETNLANDVFVLYRYYNNWRNNEIIDIENVTYISSALQTNDEGTRIAAHIYTLVSLSADITITGDTPKTVSMYFCDYQNQGYRQNITVFDRSTNSVVYNEVLSNMNGGIYLRFKVLGSFVITIKNTSEVPNTDATLSAVFFD